MTSPVPQTPEPTDTICPSTSPTLRFGREIWMCTREGGHDGDHETRDRIGVLLATWPQTDNDPSSEPVAPEPTDEQRAVAEELFPRHVGRCSWDWHYGPDGPGCSCGMKENRDAIARALAAAVTAEREKYLRVAEEMDHLADVEQTEWDLTGAQARIGARDAFDVAASRIREVSR